MLNDTQEEMIAKLSKAHYKTSDKVLFRTFDPESGFVMIRKGIIMGVRLSSSDGIYYDIQELGKIDDEIYYIHEKDVSPYLLTKKRKLNYEKVYMSTYE